MRLKTKRHEPPIRILLIVPRFGVRVAKLMEFPVVLVVIVLAARWPFILNEQPKIRIRLELTRGAKGLLKSSVAIGFKIRK